ncbi:MAG TPA: hypothetical protein VLM40_09485, partial [Gemmata sp.]|nr:hypothetical protein [Gemmata sp.]
IANVVVWLRPDSDDPTAAFSPEKLPATKVRDHLVQAGPGGFNPRILLTRAGDRVEFANPTPIAFNVFFRQPVQANEQIGAETGEFNVLLPAGQIHTTKPLVAHRRLASVSDMIHPWVHAYVWAFDHPYFAVTDEKGNFAIPDVPAGKYRLMMWQEKVGYRDGAKGRLGLRITLRGEKSMNLGRVVLSSPNWDK